MNPSLHKAPWLDRPYVRMLFALFLSACFLAVCSKSSFLYPMNDWLDVNCFFTVGRGMMHEKILYVDLYEQKGPILYFVFGLLSLVSESSFFPLYLLEILCFSLFLYYAGKCVDLYIDHSAAGYLAMLVLAAVIPASAAFSHGGSVEEMSLCMMMYSLYSILHAARDGRPLRFRESFLIGAFAAVALWTKFTLCGFYLGAAVFVLVWYLADKRPSTQLFAAIGQFLLGMAVVSAVVFAYFVYYDALPALFEVYFHDNLFSYGKIDNRTVLRFGYNFLNTLYQNPGYSILIIIGMFALLKNIKTRWRDSLAVYLTFGALVLTTYIGGRGYVYYGLILSVYAVFGLIVAAKAWQWLRPRLHWKPHPWMGYAGTAALFGVLLALAYAGSGNVYLMRYSKQDMPQYRFAEQINRVPDATMLQYGGLDGGFYYAAKKEPVNRYFCILNLNLPAMWAEQDRMVETGAVDFIVTRGIPFEDSQLDYTAYTRIDTMNFYFEGDTTYYLYRKTTAP